MNSQIVRVTIWRSASPLAEEERIKVRGFTTKIKSENHPALSLEKGEPNIALII
jgi:hypothetical protein